MWVTSVGVVAGNYSFISQVICVDPRAKEPGDNSKRHEIKTNEYTQVVLFDHMTRKKS